MIYLPFEIELFSQTWRIRAARTGEIDTDLGRCSPDQLEIVINPNQTAESMIHTIMHELTHAIELKLDLELTERQVDLISLGYINLLRLNRGIYEMIEGDSDA
jgi:hypothetical protein